MTDKNSKNNNKHNNKFFDVSFDEPIHDESRKRHNNEIHTNNDNQPVHPPRKWDNFYEKFQEEQAERYSSDTTDFNESDYASQSQANKPSDLLDKFRKPEDSNISINRSINRVKNLFNETNQTQQSDYRRIKSAKGRNLADRARLNNFHSNSNSVKKTNFSKRDNIHQDNHPPLFDTQPVDTSEGVTEQVRQKFEDKGTVRDLNRRQTMTDLPSREELARERERRRKLRIQQLEGMRSAEEIEDSYEPLNQSWSRQDLNQKSIESTQLPTQDKLVKDSHNDLVNNQNSIPKDTTVHYETLDNASVANNDKELIDNLDSIHPTDSPLENNIVSETTSTVGEGATESVDTNEFSEGDWVDDLNSIHRMTPNQDDELSSPVIVASDESNHNDNKDWVDNLSSVHLITPVQADAKSSVTSEKASDSDINQLTETDLEHSNHESDSIAHIVENADVSNDSSVDDELSFVEAGAGVSAQQGHSKTNDQATSKRQKKKEKYSLKGLSLKDKTFFGFNVTFNVIKKLLIYIVIIVVLLGVLAGGAGIGYFANLVSNTPPPTEQEMREQINQLEQQSTLYYGSGELIADVRTDIVRSIANLDDISNYIREGLIATEDEYFEEHEGIVPKAILRAVLETFVSGSGTGGSTLTQQLVKQQMLTHDVTFFRKANEMLLAVRLENYFSKEEILTAYLNVSPFGRNNKGDNVAGIAAASEGIFGVAPDEVTLPQAAFLVGLPQDPYSYTPYDQNGEIRSTESLQYGVERKNEVLFRMYRAEKITKEEYEEAIAYDITQDFLETESRPVERQTYLYQAIMNGAIEKLMLLNIQDDGYTWQQVYSDDEWYNEYYFAAEEQLRVGGYKVYSTIDKEIYDQLNASAQAYEDQLGAVYDGVYTDPETGVETYYIERVQTGLVAIDNNTGRVLGFVSGTDFENNQIDHAFNMHRSPGSTIKPLAVYGPAVENNLVNPSTVIPDTSFVRTNENGEIYEPTNYGTVVSGNFMTARTALLRSDNIPAVRIYEELLNQGVPIIDYLENMGFNTVDSYTEEATQLLPFSLGGVSSGPTVFEQTRGFSTFANNGQYVDGYYIERIEDAFGNTVFQQSKAPQQVFSEDTNYIMVDMLRDTMTEGTGRTANEYMNVPGDWIAKSGISENSKDIWFIASTPSITIGSWIGYDSRFAEYTIDINDGFDRESVRSQIYWARIVNDLYGIRPEIFGTDEVFMQPSSVQEQTVLEQTGTLPGNFTYNGSSYQLTGPTKTELFKVSNPAPALTFDFMLGASEEDLNRFWNNVRSQQAEQIRQQQQQNQPSDEESDEENEDEDSEESDSPDGEDNSGDNTEEPTPDTPNESSES